MAVPRHFRHAGLVVVRASTDPGGLCLPRMDLHTADGAETIGRAWLARMWERETVRTALHVASPALCERITAALSGAHLERRQWRRLLMAVCSYVLRWRGRPTPFGMFAGITTATVGPFARVKFGENHAAHPRVDPAWLAHVISRLEHDSSVLANLWLMVNNAGVHRGNQLVVPKPIPQGPVGETMERLAADLGAVELALQCTRPVAAVLAATAQPVRGHELITKLERDFAASREQITTMLTGLIDHQVLVTNLHAPATSTDPVEHLAAQLDILLQHAEEDGQDREWGRVAAVRDALRARHDDLSAPDRDPAASLSLAAHPAERSDSALDEGDDVGTAAPDLLPTTPPRLAVDVAVDGHLELPATVLREAETAASTLLRLTRSPFGNAAWRDYHQRFRDRYGAGAVVGIRELVSDAGLGYPRGFLGAARDQPVRPLTDRDAALQRIVQEAVLDRRTEIVLSEELIDQLTVGNHAELIPPERVELAFTLHTCSAEALRHGRFQLWVSGAPPASCSMIGRFTPLLDEQARDRLAGSYAASDPDVMVAQASFPPRRLHNDAVTRVPRLMPWLLPIAEHRPVENDSASTPGLLALDDLAVTASATQFFLIHRPTGKQVQVHVPHALETTVFTPPLVRFPAELATARSAVWGPFDFGATRTLPFLPRIRVGRSVLAPARWLLDTADLPGPKANPRDWHDAFAAWRHRWRVPAHVVMCEGEQRLPLDLDDPTQRGLLRARLHSSSTSVELREAGEPAGHRWLGRACEFVVPLTACPQRSGQHPSHPPQQTAHADRAMPEKTGGHSVCSPGTPGASSLLRAQVEGHPQRFDDILTAHLPRLYDRVQDTAVRVWFRRCNDTTRPEADHYLQLDVRLASADHYATVAAEIAAWANELRDARLAAQLSFHTAWVQVGKYGPDIPTAERVFAADSVAALAELSLAHNAQVPVQAVAAASMADLATALAQTPHRGWEWLITVLGQHHGRNDSGLREHALHLAQRLGHATNEPRAHHTPTEAAVLTAWAHRRSALVDYRAHLDRDPSTVLRALLHDHFVRTVAVNPEQEEATNHLVRAIALRTRALVSRERP
ncbi:lantibiotic dehydratase [Saccharopolyspora hattusasensis]|uniref:lantibiotic dehydratase n=1 Tax=Saccharopolyspora hattusasensis TaxID=1128679 RepID=UPI003D96A969